MQTNALKAYPVLEAGDAIASPGLVSSAATTYFEGGLNFASLLDLCQLIEALVLHDRVHYPMLSEARDLKPFVEPLESNGMLLPWYPESHVLRGETFGSKEDLWSRPGEAARQTAILAGWEGTEKHPAAHIFREYHAGLAEFSLLKRDGLFEYLFRSLPLKDADVRIERCLSKGVEDCQTFISSQSRIHQQKLSGESGVPSVLSVYWRANAGLRSASEELGATCYRSVLEQPFSDREQLESTSESLEPVSGPLNAAYIAHFRARIGRATSLIPAPPIAGAVLTEAHCRYCLYKTILEWRDRLKPLRKKTREIHTALTTLKRGTTTADAKEFHQKMGEFEAALKAAAERLENRFAPGRKLVYRISEFVNDIDSFYKLFLKLPKAGATALIHVDTSNIAGVWNIVSQFDQIEALQPVARRLFLQELNRDACRRNAKTVSHLSRAFGLSAP